MNGKNENIFYVITFSFFFLRYFCAIRSNNNKYCTDSSDLVVQLKRNLRQRLHRISLFLLKYAMSEIPNRNILYRIWICNKMLLWTQIPGPSSNSSLARRRGSDRSLSGSAHELAVCGINKDPSKVPHSHSQSNLSEIPYRWVWSCYYGAFLLCFHIDRLFCRNLYYFLLLLLYFWKKNQGNSKIIDEGKIL